MTVRRDWTDWELVYLGENYGKLTNRQIGARLDRTPDAVRRMGSTRKLKGKRGGTRLGSGRPAVGCKTCGEPVYAKELCHAHYTQDYRTTRWKSTGDNGANWKRLADAFIRPLIHVDVKTGEVLAWRWNA